MKAQYLMSARAAIVLPLFIVGLFSQTALSKDDKAAHSATSMGQLLKMIQSERSIHSKENAIREKEFVSKRDQQKKILQAAKAKLAGLERTSQNLVDEFKDNEKKLTQVEAELNLAMGTLGEMFGVVRQTAGDLIGQFENSVISAEIPDRSKVLAPMADTKSLPAIEELEVLWFEMQREMTESGKISEFDSVVVTPDGTPSKTRVSRIGSFNLAADGKYLDFQPATGQLLELPRQPSGRYLSTLSDFTSAEGESFAAFALDPSRGTILSMMVQSPSLWERVQQGGVIGYITLLLLAIGLAIVAERAFTLRNVDRRMRAQMKSAEADLGNPLGQLMATYERNKGQDLETLELKVEESILKNSSWLSRRISTVKLLSAVAPLLGLLGTVTGMIATFQSITLFGTSDPKLMAGGISQALVTTVLGLVCAIPLLLLYNVIHSKSRSLVQILEEQAVGMIANRFETQEEKV